MKILGNLNLSKNTLTTNSTNRAQPNNILTAQQACDTVSFSGSERLAAEVGAIINNAINGLSEDVLQRLAKPSTDHLRNSFPDAMAMLYELAMKNGAVRELAITQLAKPARNLTEKAEKSFYRDILIKLIEENVLKQATP